MSFLETTHQEPGPIVRSTANPGPTVLGLVRRLLQQDEELRALFIEFKTEAKAIDWLRDMLVPRVAAHLEETPFEEALAVCQYLADEYQQLACLPGTSLDDGCFVLDHETGRVVAVVPGSEIFHPGLLPRESGSLGKALPRLPPALEARLITRSHDRDREAQTLALMAQRGHQTDLLRDEGDRRLRVASRAGRSGLAKELSEEDPRKLLAGVGGTAARFLDHVRLEPPSLSCILIEGVARHRSILGIQDLRTSNLGYDRLGVLRGTIARGWVCDLARQLSLHVRAPSHAPVLMIEDLDEELVSSEEFWVAEPDVCNVIRRAKGVALPVDGIKTVGFSGHVGALWLASEFGVESREWSDKWEITATVPYRLHVDLGKIRLLVIDGIARASSVEWS